MLLSVAAFSCESTPPVQEVAITVSPPIIEDTPPPASHAGGVADEIRAFVETGTPSSLLQAVDLIRRRGLGESEFGRIMNAIAVTFLQQLYPGLQTQLPQADPPQTHPYTRLLRDAERGRYTSPPANSQDYLEYVLPFLAYLGDADGRQVPADLLRAAQSDLRRAKTLNPNSVLAPYFLALAYERSGRREEAVTEFTGAYTLSPECYPATLGLVRIRESRGEWPEAIRLLMDLVIRYPDNQTIKRQLALAYYSSGDWSRAESAIAEILQRSPRDSQFLLMRAHVLVEEGQFLQAQAPLDVYGTLDTNNRLYLFLRARVQFEGYRNRESALNYLRSLLRSYPNDDEALVYAARLLMESNRTSDQTEGRELLGQLLRGGSPSILVVGLAVQDAIRREAWQEAQPYLERLLGERRSAQDLYNAYLVERSLGNNAAALQVARELYERDPYNEEGVSAYISALIDTGRQAEAGQIIENRLDSLPGGALRGKYFYLRSRLRTSEETVMNDLRSSLFEDPRNLDALIAMFEIYQRRKDDRRAVYYLKQALAIAPDNPLIKRYESQYAALLGASN
ncbi:hypothetical protein FACS189493_4470 [Spirochaetia bacterium]|nr:hypothetical protein FACS189493_4470 [Spirochaetia bacterium]